MTLINTATPYLEKSAANGRHPSIVVVSSLGGFEAKVEPAGSPYTGLKRTQAIIAKDLSRNLGPLGIRINVIVPGVIETPGEYAEDGTFVESTFTQIRKAQPEMIEPAIQAVRLKRPGTVEEIGNVAVFLGSRLSSYVCAAEIFVDGGGRSGF